MRIARVEPLTTTRALRGPYDYRLSAEQAAGAAVGSVVRVTFAGRKLSAVITELADRSDVPAEKLLDVERVVGMGVPAALVPLALWMADEYVSTPARALSLLLPPGVKQGQREKQVLVASLTAAGVDTLGSADDAPAAGDGLTAAQRALLARLHELGGEAVASELGTAALRRLERRGLVAIAPRAQRRRPAPSSLTPAQREPPLLTADQAAVLADVLASLGDGTGDAPRELLIHGVTGSGKTEVYLQAVQATLAAGRTAIVLVPEIALTPQTVGRFTARFGDTVAVLHSALSQGERHDEWLRLRRGEARVAVGPRSAVFAPLGDLGLVVVDEEHDASYKHEGDPRYDARTVARRRCRAAGAVLLCGSATPRPEAVQVLHRLRLPRRVDGQPLPGVDVLDMRGLHHPLHPETRLALGDVRRAGRKAIILVNRRGWSNFLTCRSCGHVWSCPNCDVSLVLHMARGVMSCHHCGHREAVPDHCSVCRSVALARYGAGTERMQTELAEALATPEFPVFRLDADTAAGTGGVEARLAEFARAPGGVLVGTQIVAKGHDFPNVALAVVLDADSTLRFPDFRAEERTFALVTQLAGRAGRGSHGRVLVQTITPGARSIEHASRHDSEGFLTGELARRRILGYPPFGSLIRLTLTAEQEAPLDELAAGIATRVRDAPGLGLAPPRASLLGPAPLFRVRNRYRRQLVLKTPHRRAAITAVRVAVEAVAGAASRLGVSVSVDVDPQ